MEEVGLFIEQLENNQRKVAQRLHHLILSFPKSTAKIRFKVPFYFAKSWVCYLNPIKKEAVELAFTRASELSNENGILQFNGRRQVAGITYYSLKEINETKLIEVLNEAFILDETISYASKRK